MVQIFLRVKKLYHDEGGVFPGPILNLTWDYRDPNDPKADELAREMNGRALATVYDAADPTKVVAEAGQQRAFSWPANRRILYNAASCDPQGKPWDPSRKIIEWTGEK